MTRQETDRTTETALDGWPRRATPSRRATPGPVRLLAGCATVGLGVCAGLAVFWILICPIWVVAVELWLGMQYVLWLQDVPPRLP